MPELPLAAASQMGPRPLALHLSTALAVLGTSPAVLTSLNSAWPGWKESLQHPALAEMAVALRRDLDAVLGASPENPESSPVRARFLQALENNARQRFALFLDGISQYRAHPRRPRTPVAALWEEGTTRLLDYSLPRVGGRAGPLPLLLVPSLVNRYHVLDLAEGNSFLRWLADRGIAPWVVDWDAPGPAETAFTLGDYTARLARAADFMARRYGRPPALLGYCMGGLLALTLAVRRPDLASRLILLATPWDFHTEDGASPLAPLLPVFRQLAQGLGQLPTDAVQMLFTLLDPLLALRKFTRFAGLPPESPRRDAFVQLEDWLNDGVPLAGPAAVECLRDWYVRNAPVRGLWAPGGGSIVRGQDCHLPALCLIPQNDRIVPAASALALASALPDARIQTPQAGHIGMMTGRGASAACWQPVLDFLRPAAA